MICKTGFMFDTFGKCVGLGSFGTGLANCLLVSSSDSTKCEICQPGSFMDARLTCIV